MKTENQSINQIITALMELEAKGCHSVAFEYGNGLFRVRIFNAENGKVKCEKTIDPIREQAELGELYCHIENLKIHTYKTEFQCYKREFVNGEKSGKWEKTKPSFEFGDNATQSMLIDGSGYYIDDPDNEMQYFVDMQHLSETDLQ
jgi:predicted amidohydrolase YtcJ